VLGAFAGPRTDAAGRTPVKALWTKLTTDRITEIATRNRISLARNANI
jgi:hypothetical protein